MDILRRKGDKERTVCDNYEWWVFWPMPVVPGSLKTEAGGMYKFKASLGLKSGTPSQANSKH